MDDVVAHTHFDLPGFLAHQFWLLLYSAEEIKEEAAIRTHIIQWTYTSIAVALIVCNALLYLGTAVIYYGGLQAYRYLVVPFPKAMIYWGIVAVFLLMGIGVLYLVA